MSPRHPAHDQLGKGIPEASDDETLLSSREAGCHNSAISKNISGRPEINPPINTTLRVAKTPEKPAIMSSGYVSSQSL